MDFTTWFQNNTFWCAGGTDAAMCAGLLQARAVLAGAVLLAFFLWRVVAALKRQNAFADTRLRERRISYAQFLQSRLASIADLLDNTADPLPFDGPLSPEEWENRSLLPVKLVGELDKLRGLIVKYNASLAKSAAKPAATQTGAELSALLPSAAPRPVNDLKKQVAKCRKMAASVR